VHNNVEYTSNVAMTGRVIICVRAAGSEFVIHHYRVRCLCLEKRVNSGAEVRRLPWLRQHTL